MSSFGGGLQAEISGWRRPRTGSAGIVVGYATRLEASSIGKGKSQGISLADKCKCVLPSSIASLGACGRPKQKLLFPKSQKMKIILAFTLDLGYAGHGCGIQQWLNLIVVPPEFPSSSSP